MRPTRLIPALAAVVLALGLSPLAQAAPESIDLQFLGTTDLHGHVYPTDYYSDAEKPLGLARVATLVKRLRAENPHTLLVDSGDLLQGSPFVYHHARLAAPRGPHPMIKVMNLMGYDAFTVGNHDWDYGLGYLQAAEREARFPFLAGNIVRAGKDLFKPYVIREVGGVKVGILGLSQPGISLMDSPDIKGKVMVGDVVQAAGRWLPVLQREGAEVILVLPHVGLGGKYGPAYTGYAASTGLPPEQVGLELARAYPQIDVLFAAHSHQDVPSEVENGVACAQALNQGRRLAVAKLHLAKVDGRWQVRSKTTDTLKVDGVTPDPEVLALVKPEHEAAIAYVHAPIATTHSDWPAARADQEDSAIMDLVHEVQLKTTGAQLSAAACFSREGGFRPGSITIADVARLYPYENTLYAIRVTGAQLRSYLEHAARYWEQDAAGAIGINPKMPSFNHDMLAGAQYRVDPRQPVGQRIVELRYQGQPVRDEASFTLALNSYRQTGGGGYEMLKGCPVVYNQQEGIRELLIEHLKARGKIEPSDVFRPNWEVMRP